AAQHGGAGRRGVVGRGQERVDVRATHRHPRRLQGRRRGGGGCLARRQTGAAARAAQGGGSVKAGTATRRKWRADWKRVMRRFARTTASGALAFVAAWCLAGDGPYVVRSEHGRWQALFVDDGEQGVARQRVETLPDDGAEITVAAVGKVPAF